jgi:hypothetical protein
MQKYHDRPWDFADARLVQVARRESLVMFRSAQQLSSAADVRRA